MAYFDSPDTADEALTQLAHAVTDQELNLEDMDYGRFDGEDAGEHANGRSSIEMNDLPADLFNAILPWLREQEAEGAVEFNYTHNDGSR